MAEDEADFVARAAAMAGDLTGWSDCAANCAPRLLASPLCDGPRFARHLEAALRGMWQHWCAGAPGMIGPSAAAAVSCHAP